MKTDRQKDIYISIFTAALFTIVKISEWLKCLSMDEYIKKMWRWSWDDGGIARGDHFLPHKFIERTFEWWVNSTKQLLNAGRGHQASRKADLCLQKQVGKNIKDEKRDKGGREGALSWEGSLKKREVSKHQETLSLESVASLGSTEGNITGRKNR